MKSKPTITGTGAELFFPSAMNKRNKEAQEQRQRGGKTNDSRTEQMTVERKRVARYRKAWKKEGLTQISLWLPSGVVGRLRAKALRKNKKMSNIAAEILSEGL